jgi:undecaprenyl pyrophosphate synthase
MLEALILKLRGEIAVAKANVDVYLNNAAGIGEHPDIVEAVETQIEKIASAEEKIETIQKHFDWL